MVAWTRVPRRSLWAPHHSSSPGVLLSEACALDGWVALLEAVYVQLAIHRGRQVAVPVCSRPPQVPLRKAREALEFLDLVSVGRVQSQ